MGLLAFNLSQKVVNDYLKVCTLGLLIFKFSQKVANDFLKVYTWFACIQLESEG